MLIAALKKETNNPSLFEEHKGTYTCPDVPRLVCGIQEFCIVTGSRGQPAGRRLDVHEKRKGAYGFTLIEILIVIVIISIISAVAVITIHTNQNKQFETFSNQLTNLLRLAEQEAMLRPTTLGLAFTNKTYRFYEYQETNKTWQFLTDKNLTTHNIPNNIQITLKIQGKKIDLNGKPQIIITPSNDLTPFIILIGKKDEEAQYQIIGNANGEITSAEMPEE